jgi:crotonobetaine/carnitine-CoA ligase
MPTDATRGRGLLTGTGFDLGPHALRYPVAERTLLRVLADQAHDRPDHPWLVFDGTDVLTFGTAYDLVLRVAASLRASFEVPGHVALLLRNQYEFMPAFYGAMAAGGITVPLNAEARGPLLHKVLDVSDATALIVRTDLLDRLNGLTDLAAVELVVAVGDGELPAQVAGVPVVAWADWLVDDPTEPDRWPTAFDTALIQFTSGTTGTSKGAIYSHHFLYLYCAMPTDSLGHGPDDVLSTPMPMFHVAALHLIANSALQAGCTAHMKSKFSAREFWNQIAADRATFSIILGPMAAIIDKTVSSAPEHRLKGMFCVPPPPGHEEFEAKFNVLLLYQGYGMTEVYPLPMPPAMRPGVASDTIGIPVSWMDYGVVDENDQLVDPGVPGELVFRPRLPYSMINGYYGDPAATVHALRNFAFHTGDIGVYDEDGTLHYRGRMQEHIRRRGENVSAPELEHVALSHSAVLEAAAYGVPSALGEHDIKLDVVLTEDIPLDELYEWLRDNLPKYMVPRYLERRDSFPKTPSERVEKYRLVSLTVDRPEVLDAGER